ncbi:CE192 protein, partial [Nyctiprogne leucopyga]|nr:CE192 protein [Nyctiprogne leucopyga]
MEDFRNIADETFPSFLGHSLNSSASVISENVTISSNPGLPVAASTVARSKTGCDNRLSDIGASYLEGKHSPPSGSSHSSQSDTEPMGRFALSFRDDMEVATQVKGPQPTTFSLKESRSIYGEQDQNVLEHSNRSQDTLLEVLPLEQLEVCVSGLFLCHDLQEAWSAILQNSYHLVVWQEHNKILITLHSFVSDLSTGICFPPDNDDIDDEEFFDNQLEAYFEQLIQPEMTRGDTDTQKLSECCTALKLSENGLLQV